MTIAASVQDCLAREGVHYDMIAHERTRDSNHTAQAAHVPGDRLAKCVADRTNKGPTVNEAARSPAAVTDLRRSVVGQSSAAAQGSRTASRGR
jgi:prolyl-tRNA editing enzyme YbaK/EbsC (Cys-tRNA(Pro) deacylase)